MNTKAIASNVRRLREERHWSQEEFAMATGIDVRTVQRAEAGKPLSRDTVKAIAAAFNMDIEMLQVSEEKLLGAIQEFRRKYRVIDMRIIGRSSNVGQLISASEAFLLQRIGDLSDKQLDQVAEFEEELRDYLDIWSDLPATGRRDGERALFESLESITRGGMSVSVGLEPLRLRLKSDEPFHVTIFHVAIAAGSQPMLALVRDKTTPISFGG